jgi:tRNA threonylcarbamoyladenosine biosynthesis protein TsaB
LTYILNIDTAVENSSVCLSLNGDFVAMAMNANQKDSAAWIQPAIKNMLTEQKVALKQLKAIALSNGPGSYTGLRVGMATAKGLCYALNIPLITISTLKMMAISAIHMEADLYCPMIDARRMEIFTAIYDRNLTEVKSPFNLVLDQQYFQTFLASKKILFFGNGSVKFQQIINRPNALFVPIESSAKHLARESFLKLKNGDLVDIAYSEPFYIKEFYSPPSKPIL